MENSSKAHTREKANEIFQQIRIILPGTQALLGFQFVVIFNPVFQDLSEGLKQLHIVTLLLTMVCTILLVAPVAFHQIGEDGHTTKGLIRFSGFVVTIALGLLLLAMVGDAYIASIAIGFSSVIAIMFSVGILVLGATLLFGYTLLRRQK